MRHAVFSMFAIGLAGLAAVAATTAFLNTPAHIGPPATDKPATSTTIPPAPPPETPPGTPPSTPPTAPEGDKPATPSPSPSPSPSPAPAPAPGGAGAPASPDGKPVAAGEPESDADPYEGIAPEELPPDLQYDADSSVSFPTNI